LRDGHPATSTIQGLSPDYWRGASRHQECPFRQENLAKAVIENPEESLDFLSTSLRWLFGITFLFAPLWIWLRTNSFATALAFQIAPLLNWMPFVEGGIYFKPESLINTLILWFCAWVASPEFALLHGDG
jgi:hypothetical protein